MTKSRLFATILIIGLVVVGGFLLINKSLFKKGMTKLSSIPPQETLNMKIASNAFDNNQKIPAKYTCDGENINPPLLFSEVPSEAKSLVLIVDDPDAPAGTWDHWLVWNIPAKLVEIQEDNIPEGSVEGVTSFGKSGYGGPCPPSGEHRYFFKLYALDTVLDLSPSAGKTELENAVEGHVLASSHLVGLYSR